MRTISCLLLAAIAAGFALSLTGCNTIKGAGVDIVEGADTVHGWFKNGEQAPLPAENTTRTAAR